MLMRPGNCTTDRESPACGNQTRYGAVMRARIGEAERREPEDDGASRQAEAPRPDPACRAERERQCPGLTVPLP